MTWCDCKSSSDCILGKTGRAFKICSGQSNLPPEKVASYRRLFAKQAGIDVYGSGSPFAIDLISATRRSSNIPTPTIGVGTELKNLLSSKYNIHATGDCKCNKRARQMDENGIYWCETNKSTIVRWLKEGAAEKFWLKPIVSITGQLADVIAQRIVDEAINRAREKMLRFNLPVPKLIDLSKDHLRNTTIAVKSFQRHSSLLRLLRSIRRHYLHVPILVADDSGKTYKSRATQLCKQIPGVAWLDLPYDTGLPYGRNRLVERCVTDNVILCDDDFVFTEETRIERLVYLLDTTDLDIVGGLVRMDGYHAESWSGWLRIEHGTLRSTHLQGGWMYTNGIRWRRSHMILNFFASKTKTLLNNRWDESYKIKDEHIDSLLTWCKSGLNLGYTLDCVSGHWFQAPSNYRKFRNRDNGNMFIRKWGLRSNKVLGRIKEPAVPNRSVKHMLEEERK